jgi:hypothetical protein
MGTHSTHNQQLQYQGMITCKPVQQRLRHTLLASSYGFSVSVISVSTSCGGTGNDDGGVRCPSLPLSLSSPRAGGRVEADEDVGAAKVSPAREWHKVPAFCSSCAPCKLGHQTAWRVPRAPHGVLMLSVRIYVPVVTFPSSPLCVISLVSIVRCHHRCFGLML